MNGVGQTELGLLRERAERACGGMLIDAAFAKVRAIIGPSVFPKGEEVAAAAMAKLKAGEVPSPMERTALETVIKALRPSILSQGGDLRGLPPYRNYPEQFLSEWASFRAAVKPYLYSIGRIDRVSKPSDEPLATGFLIAKNTLVTNKHVLAALSADTFQLERGQAVVRFGQEWGTQDVFDAVAITGVLAVHSTLDMVVLETEENNHPPLAVGRSTPSLGTEVVAIGYPQDDPRSPVFRDVIFEGKYKVKRAAPGEITGSGVASVYHDCSTLGGNSGSPLLTIDNPQVVGLHRDGPLFLYRNEAVDGTSLYAFVQPYMQ